MERTYERSKAGFISRVMMFMGTGLLVTFVVAYLTATSQTMLNLMYSLGNAVFIVFALEIGLVVYLSRRINKMSLAQAKVAFYAYAVVNGITFYTIFLMYPIYSIINIFLISSVMFLAAGTIGMSIKKDLSGMARFLMLAVIGLIAASIVNIFLGSTSLDLMVSAIAVIIFSALTAYDMQKIQAIHHSAYYMNEEAVGKFAILGALSLYLDFINIFISLLRIFGSGRR